MIEIKFKKEHPDAVLPTKTHLENLYDYFPKENIIFHEGYDLTDKEKYLEYDLGFSTEIPIGYKGIIVPRSSISKYNLIMCNSPAQIDSSYRGTWKIRFKFLSEEQYKDSISNLEKIYKKGDKIAQIFFEPVLQVSFIETEELSVTERGIGGFGSTDFKK